MDHGCQKIFSPISRSRSRAAPAPCFRRNGSGGYSRGRPALGRVRPRSNLASLSGLFLPFLEFYHVPGSRVVFHPSQKAWNSNLLSNPNIEWRKTWVLQLNSSQSIKKRTSEASFMPVQQLQNNSTLHLIYTIHPYHRTSDLTQLDQLGIRMKVSVGTKSIVINIECCKRKMFHKLMSLHEN